MKSFRKCDLVTLVKIRSLLEQFAKGNAYCERADLDRLICRIMGIEYYHVTMREFEKRCQKILKEDLHTA